MGAQFFHEYFFSPILQNGWFNPVNTTVYAVILIIAVYFVYKMLLKMKINIDSRFFLAILPFIFWGSSTRVLHDAAVAGVLTETIYNTPIFVTPGSYIITFSLALTILIISLLIQRFAKFSYWKPMFIIGIILCGWNIYILPLVTFYPILLVLSFTALWSGLFFIVYKILERMKNPFKSLLSWENQGILASHILDAAATFTALFFFGYVEQHVVPRLFFPFFGPISMFLLKIIVILPVLFIVDRYAENKNFKNFLKIVILILGLAPGLRDVIRLIAMV